MLDRILQNFTLIEFLMVIVKITKETGVCKSIVSFVLNGKAKQNHIRDATVKKIQSYCHSVNYLPNIHAVRMNRAIVGNIMVLLNTQDAVSGKNSFTNYNVAQIVGGIAQEAEKVGFTFSIRIFHPGLEETLIFNSFRNREVDGQIFYGMEIPARWLDIFRAEERKVVGIGIRPTPGISTVNINNREVSAHLTEQLAASGSRKFLYLTGTAESFPGRERFAGFLSVLKRHDIPFPENQCLYAGFSEELARKVILEYFAENAERPDAIVCANDRMALGVLSALKSLGTEFSGNITVTGGDNIEPIRYLPEPLMTFDNLPGQLGENAFRMLYRRIHGETVENDLILRSNIMCESAIE